MADSSLCSSCSNAIRCNTWAEWRCSVKKKRIYNHKEMTDCESYKKRPNNWKETPCQCKFCLINENLIEGFEESGV